MTIEALVISAVVAVAAGLIGCFAVIRRMSLAADALSHVALPGIGIALALHINVLLGAVAMLFFGALLVWALENRTRVATETVIGVVFSAALAVGSMMSSGDNLIEALFGGSASVSWQESLFGLAAALTVIVLVIRQRHKLVIALVSPELARTAGINVRRLNWLYLQLFALTVALGLRHLGVLLMGSLIIIPAAAAKNVSKSLTQMLVTAAVVAVVATVVGTALAAHLHREPGPVVVMIAAAVFVATALRGR